MFKKILIGLAALGLTASVPAQARSEFGVTIQLGNQNHRNYDYNRRGYGDYNRNPYDNYRNHNPYDNYDRNPCRKREVLVQERRYPHRLYCVDKREYQNYYGNSYGWRNEDQRRGYRY